MRISLSMFGVSIFDFVIGPPQEDDGVTVVDNSGGVFELPFGFAVADLEDEEQ